MLGTYFLGHVIMGKDREIPRCSPCCSFLFLLESIVKREQNNILVNVIDTEKAKVVINNKGNSMKYMIIKPYPAWLFIQHTYLIIKPCLVLCDTQICTKHVQKMSFNQIKFQLDYKLHEHVTYNVYCTNTTKNGQIASANLSFPTKYIRFQICIHVQIVKTSILIINSLSINRICIILNFFND